MNEAIYTIRYDQSLRMFVVLEGKTMLMKNKSQSKLAIKLGKWLQSQGK